MAPTANTLDPTLSDRPLLSIPARAPRGSFTIGEEANHPGSYDGEYIEVGTGPIFKIPHGAATPQTPWVAASGRPAQEAAELPT